MGYTDFGALLMVISGPSLTLLGFLFHRAGGAWSSAVEPLVPLPALRLAKRAVSQRAGGARALLSDLCEVGVRVGRCFSGGESQKKRGKRKAEGRKDKGEEGNFELFLYSVDFLPLGQKMSSAVGPTDGRTD